MGSVEYQKKKSELERKLSNANIIAASAGFVGGLAGILYSVKTKRGFWGGVGFFFLGSLTVGVSTRLGMIIWTNKLDEQAKNLEAEYNNTKNGNSISSEMKDAVIMQFLGATSALLPFSKISNEKKIEAKKTLDALNAKYIITKYGENDYLVSLK